jgi:hypothetical protein
VRPSLNCRESGFVQSLESQKTEPLVLYMKLLRQVSFHRRPEPCARKDRGSFRRPVQAGVIILACCGLHERAAHCIKRRLAR